MQYISHYDSPLGQLLLAADDVGLTGLWFEGQAHFAAGLEPVHQEKTLPVFADTKRWLDFYFSGSNPDFLPPIHLLGTPFQTAVWQFLLTVPYGQTVTYGQIARALGIRSAQAVGGAVGRNPVSILVPCHRVLGADGSLTGYAGGLERKAALLALEGHI